MLDLGGMDWSIHTAATISAGRAVAVAGVVCFWIFALLAMIGAFTRAPGTRRCGCGRCRC